MALKKKNGICTTPRDYTYLASSRTKVHHHPACWLGSWPRHWSYIIADLQFSRNPVEIYLSTGVCLQDLKENGQPRLSSKFLKEGILNAGCSLNIRSPNYTLTWRYGQPTYFSQWMQCPWIKNGGWKIQFKIEFLKSPSSSLSDTHRRIYRKNDIFLGICSDLIQQVLEEVGKGVTNK